MKVLEIGPGTTSGRSLVFPTADTVDFLGEPTYRAHWGLEPLPIPDNQYDLVIASHVLEHVPWYRTQDALREVYRIVKPGGRCEITVPDFELIVRSYLQKRCGDTWRVFNSDGDWMTWVNGRIFTYGEDAVELLSAERPIPQTHHKAVFDRAYLKACLEKSGFKVELLVQRQYGRSHGPIEISAQGNKPV